MRQYKNIFGAHTPIWPLYVVRSVFIFMISCQTPSSREEIQITSDLRYNHDLDNNDNFSPDDQWLVYDTRTEAGGIEKVHVHTGEKVVLYHLPQNQSYGPGVGAVSYSHTENKIIFIHGLHNVTAENPYQQWRRTGVMVDDAQPGEPIFMDARDVTYPFTPGALRGGTHRHEWSGDGQWIGFTYNDAIMKALEDSTAQPWNLRTIGVSKRKPVEVDQDPAGENVSGTWFSALVVRVVPAPAPGSDEISRAAGDSWVGGQGYQKPDGSWQIARAFIGTVSHENGKPVDEVCIVDIPEQIDRAGEYGPLEGTDTSFPMPSQGTLQRRLTYTAHTPYPGCEGIVRSSPDGSNMAYLAYDDRGVKQVFLISPFGGEPRQLTDHPTAVQSGVRWSPDGQQVCYVWDNSLILCQVSNAPFASRHERLTAPADPSPLNPVWSHDGTLIAYNKKVAQAGSDSTKQIFVIKL